MAKKAYFKRLIYYNEDFEDQMELFERNISIDDKNWGKLKKKHRFSAVIRFWIESYNRKFAKEVLDRGQTNKTQNKAESNSAY